MIEGNTKGNGMLLTKVIKEQKKGILKNKWRYRGVYRRKEYRKDL